MAGEDQEQDESGDYMGNVRFVHKFRDYRNIYSVGIWWRGHYLIINIPIGNIKARFKAWLT
jgi:hypothetical protein